MTLKEVREIAERKKAIRKRKNSRQKGARGEREVARAAEAKVDLANWKQKGAALAIEKYQNFA